MRKADTVTIYGHRGSPEKAVENTIPSFLQAVEDGADGIELDVQMSLDGRVMVFHDGNLARLAGNEMPVSKLTSDELKSLELKAGLLPPGNIPFLEEVFEAIPKATLVNVEMKGAPPSHDGMEAAVIDILERFWAFDRVVISSFNPVRLRHTRKLCPKLKTAFLHSGVLTTFPNRTLLRLSGRIDGLHPHYGGVDEDYLKYAKTHDLFVNAWTVDEEDDIRRMIGLGVNGIISDRPGLVRSIVG